jgi:hypothetical protein
VRRAPAAVSARSAALRCSRSSRLVGRLDI